jgi:hypothetical protein
MVIPRAPVEVVVVTHAEDEIVACIAEGVSGSRRTDLVVPRSSTDEGTPSANEVVSSPRSYAPCKPPYDHIVSWCPFYGFGLVRSNDRGRLAEAGVRRPRPRRSAGKEHSAHRDDGDND